MKIIYPLYDENNQVEGVAVMAPSLNCGLTVEQIAQKDVDFGVPYKIVEDDVIPTDRTFRDAWTVNVEDLTDGTGADFGCGSDNLPPDDFYIIETEEGMFNLETGELIVDEEGEPE